MAMVLGAFTAFRKSIVVVAYAPDPAQMRKAQGEPVWMTLSAVAVGITSGTCFWSTAGTMARVFSLEYAPRMMGTWSWSTSLLTPCTAWSGRLWSS